MATNCSSGVVCTNPAINCTDTSYGIDCDCQPWATFTHGPSCQECIFDTASSGFTQSTFHSRTTVEAMLITSLCVVVVPAIIWVALFVIFRKRYRAALPLQSAAAPTLGFGWNTAQGGQAWLDHRHISLVLFAVGFVLYESTIHSAGLFHHQLLFHQDPFACWFFSIVISLGLLCLAVAELRQSLRQWTVLRFAQQLSVNSQAKAEASTAQTLYNESGMTWSSVVLWLGLVLLVLGRIFFGIIPSEEHRPCCYRWLNWNTTDLVFSACFLTFQLGNLGFHVWSLVLGIMHPQLISLSYWLDFGVRPSVEAGAVKGPSWSTHLWFWLHAAMRLTLCIGLMTVVGVDFAGYHDQRGSSSSHHYHPVSHAEPLFKGELMLLVYWLWLQVVVVMWYIYTIGDIHREETHRQDLAKVQPMRLPEDMFLIFASLGEFEAQLFARSEEGKQQQEMGSRGKAMALETLLCYQKDELQKVVMMVLFYKADEKESGGKKKKKKKPGKK